MKKIVVAILLITSFCYGQEKIPFVDYDEVLEKIRETEDVEKKLSLIDKISKNDSAYYSLLTTKSYYLLELEKYKEAVKVTNEGINASHNHSKVFFYINKGVALSSLGNYNEALKNYDEAIKLYPKYYLLWHNKAYVLETQGKLNDAINAYKKAISFNPLYKKPHLQIGNIFYKQERFTQALMCFNMYLLLEPDDSGAFETLKSLNNIVRSQNSNKRNKNLRLVDADDNFEEIDLTLTGKIALNENYKTGNAIEIALTKQNHAMIMQLKNFEGKEGFWAKTYVPFYQWIAQSNKFDDFIYTSTYSIENEDYKKIIEKNRDKIVSFLGDLKAKWKNLVAKNNIEINGEQKEVIFEYNDSYVNGVGQKKDGKPIGNWKFYNESGQNFAIGNFDANGKRTGKWTWFHKKGNIKEIANYIDGKLEGKNFMYHNNGKKYVNAVYKNDSLTGLYEYFNNKGALVQRKYFKSGNLHGDYKSYFNVGEKLIEFEIPYKEGEVHGNVFEYYANGDLYAKSTYTSGYKNGLETVYHFNKKVSSEIEFVDGKTNGSYKSYHSNGKPNEIGQCINGEYDGSWKKYFYDGTLESEFIYKNGKLNGLCKYYDTDGKLHYDFHYRKGEIIAYTFYNKEGKIIQSAKKKGGEFFYKGTSPKGNVTAEGLYDISGGKIGEWKFYSNNGVLQSKGNYKENKIDGDFYTYFKNGEIDNVAQYKDDVLEGYYYGNHKNGKMSAQGWYKAGKEHGEWRYYFKDGTIKAINFYHKGQLNGEQKYFAVNGQLSSTALYIFDDLISEEVYDKNKTIFEKIIHQSKKNEYSIVYKHFNGNIKSSAKYVNEVMHGTYKKFYANGNKQVTGNYLNGFKHGLWTWFYNDGAIETKAYYLRGNLNGNVINYYKNGKIEDEYVYENGNSIGVDRSYNINGSKEGVAEYKNGKRHGRREFYDPSGKLQLIRFYNYGELVGYSYLNKNGTEVDMIPLDRESGKINAFFDNGKPSKTMEYQFGDFVNTYKSYTYDGTILDETNYKNGEYHGVKKSFFTNGTLKETTTYNFGDKHGKQTTYYENGNKKEEKVFLNNVAHGMSYFYNEAGKLIRKKEYFNGEVYKIEEL